MTMKLSNVTPCQYERMKAEELRQNPDHERFKACPYIPVIVTDDFILAIVPQRKSTKVELFLKDIPAPTKRSRDIQKPTSLDWEKAFYIANEIIEHETA